MSSVARLLCAAGALLFCVKAVGAAMIWTGPMISFVKPDGVDWTLASNQDRLTDEVWITRQNTQGIFNLKQESVYTHNLSPTGTQWAFGRAAEWPSLMFSSWEQWAGGSPNITGIVGRNAVLHLIEGDVYLDLKFLSWTGSAGGGGFSYERSTPAPEPSTLSLLALAGLVTLRLVRL